MFSPFFPPSFWMQALWGPVFLVVWWLGRRRPGAWPVNLALLLVAAAPSAIAGGWFLWFCVTMGRAGYTGLVDPHRIEHLHEHSILGAFFVSGLIAFLFVFRGIALLAERLLLRRKGAADTAGNKRSSRGA
ncbi:hypothetical protein TSACC_2812 [Terrimicrobium sacchariphilum]|uniref:Uncharacterized protein n=1 Tax=Terrimicrobium sacchariphilum TaxID=690879 RepID=A0A146G627_TERSA|nr:hypothetical protein [Terrimicrobium sacchariphilum]GAT32414.1 hypothetical protein TSACC_2812 [Terrimicrobium sacchariphilum]